MKKRFGFSWRLAATGIKKNSKLYIPYILAEIGMTAVFYILYAMSDIELLSAMGGGRTLKIVLNLGSFVMAIFSLGMLFYTNTFIIRTRIKEFGLYNILGMGKRNIAGLLVAETVISGGLSILTGIAAGLILSKLAEILLAALLGVTPNYALSIDLPGIGMTLLLFLIINLLVMLKSVIKICRLNTIDLLKNEKTGEKPPKAGVLLAVCGFIILGIAYYMAVSISDPLKAILLFFVAVIMVIVATYILFIVGSVTICKLLQKKKGYYYKTEHFVSLSTMSFRMKRNGAGLALICILSTMVLVMIASSSCMYFGKETMFNERYPRLFMNEIGIKAELDKSSRDIIENRYRTLCNEIIVKNNASATNIMDMEILWNTLRFEDGEFSVDEKIYSYDALNDDRSDIWDVCFISTEDYNSYTGENCVLNDNEAICCEYGDRFRADKVRINGELDYTIKERVEDFYRPGAVSSSLGKIVVFIVNKLPLEDSGIFEGRYIRWEYNFDILGDIEDNSEIANMAREAGNKVCEEFENKLVYCLGERRDEAVEDFFALYGGLFFIGCILSFIFISALVMMLYYRQISEGYEDRSRFEIMQKIGMTDADIRRSINSQMKTVFYMPLLAAVVHLCFAFPMIYRCLIVIGISSLSSLLTAAAVSVAAFAIIYTIVYKITSNSYYKLVK